MNKTTAAQQTKTNSFLPATQGALRRKCACGNHTMAGGECADCAKKKVAFQRKLTIGVSNDPLEQEADRVADQVMAAPTNAAVNNSPPRIQRYTGQVPGDAGIAPPSIDHVLASSGRPLESALRQDMEQRFGHDFSQVRVHTGSSAEQSARDVNAHAYTVGHHIVFGPGGFAPNTQGGRRLIAHELTHVIQQSPNDFGVNGQNNKNIEFPQYFGQIITKQLTPLQINRYADPLSEVIFRSESIHPEEQHCEDISRDSTASCKAIIDCIEELIEQLAGRFHDIESKGGDAGHEQRIKIVQNILKTLMTMARATCKQGEYDEELAKEAEKWANKPVQREIRGEEEESVWAKLRKYLPDILVVGLITIGAVAAGAALVACFASGACEFALALAGVGLVLAVGITAALKAAGVKDQPSTTA